MLSVSMSTVAYTIECYKETGSTTSREKSGHQRSDQTKKLVEVTGQKISRNKRRSIRKTATEAKVSHDTMRRVVRNDLPVYLYKLQKCQRLSGCTMEKRLAQSKEHWKSLTCRTIPRIIQTDEKTFTIQQAFNS